MMIYSRNSQHLVIFPDKPQWLIVDDVGKSLLEMLAQQQMTVDEIAEQFPPEQNDDIRASCSELLEICGKDDDKQSIAVESPLTSRTTVAMIGITRRCNLKCPHCYVDAHDSISSEELKLADHFRLAEQINECLATDPKVKYRINLTGGEPFVRKNIISIIRAYRESSLEVAMSTNGLQIKDDQIPMLRELEVTLSVSLDGARADEHDAIRGEGTFSQVVEKISILLQNGIRVGINHLLHSGNVQSLEQTIDLAYQLGCTGFNPINLVQLGRACDSSLKRVSETEVFCRIANHLALYPEQLAMFQRTSLFSSMGAALLSGITCVSCGVGNRPCVYVAPEGDIYPCANTQRPEFRLGNIHETPLKTILREDHPVIAGLRGLNVSTLNPICGECDVRLFCGGDCRGETYNVTGDLRAPYVACQDRHDSIVELMWIVAEHPELFEQRAGEFIINATRAI